MPIRLRWWKPMRKAPRACGVRTASPTRCSPTCWNWTWATCSRAWPGRKRPQDRILLADCEHAFTRNSREDLLKRPKKSASVTRNGETFELRRRGGADCRNHQLHQHFQSVGHGRRRPAGPQTPGRGAAHQALGQDQPGARLSSVVSNYLETSGLNDDLDALGFNIVGFGCTTCIGNSGPLDPNIDAAVRENDLLGDQRCCPAIATSKAASTRNWCACQLSGLAAAGGGLRARRQSGRGCEQRAPGP